MFNLIFKDIKLLSRNRSDLMQLLLMPMILISILGFAFGGLDVNEFHIDSFPVALVEEGDNETEVNQFAEQLSDEGLPEQQISELTAVTEEFNPRASLINVLQSDDIGEWIDIREFDSKEDAQEALKQDDVEGIIIIPENFSRHVWNQVFLEEEEVSTLELEVLNFDHIYTDIIRSVLNTFVDRYNLETSIASSLEGQVESEDIASEPEEYGNQLSIGAEEPVTSFQYYTIGMGVMFALYTAPSIASRAFKEKEQHVFGRLMISNSKPLTYLLSKFVSGAVIALIQLAILFSVSTVLFGTFGVRTMPYWINIASLTVVYSIIVGAITSLLTSIVLFFNDNTTSEFFGGIVVTLFSLIGGSLVPLQDFSDTLRALGNWTPNGAAMTGYLQLTQGFALSEITFLIVRLLLLSVVIIFISLLLFPKRRLD